MAIRFIQFLGTAFLKSGISQGSVATFVRCGGIFDISQGSVATFVVGYLILTSLQIY